MSGRWLSYFRSSLRGENTSNVSHTSFTLIKISFKKCLVPQTWKLIFQLLKQNNFHQVKHVCKKISKVENFFCFFENKKIFLTETSQMCLRYYCLVWENPIIFWLPLGFVWRKCQLLSEFSDSTGLDRCASQSRWTGTRGFHLISSQPFTVTAQSLHYVWLLKIYTLLSLHCDIFPSCPVIIIVTLEVRLSERPRELRPLGSLLPSVSMPDGGPFGGKPPAFAAPPPDPPPPPTPLLFFRVWVPLRPAPFRLPRELRLKSDDLKWRYGRALKVGVGEAEPAV